MQVAVISDLHLGPGDVTDEFGHDDAEFLRFLRFLETNFERIVLLGDIWETLTPRRPGDLDHALDAARAAHSELAARFAGPKYRYVHGNHDFIAGAAVGAPDELVLREAGARVLFTHGHDHDVLIRRARWLSELGVWVGGWLRRCSLRGLYRLFDRIDQARGGESADASKCTFQRWAVGLARQRDVDIVVTGHTHIAARSDHGDRLFLNSGSCSRGQISFLSLDTRRGEGCAHCAW